MTSFVTAIKLMPLYEDYARRLEMYIECVAEGMRGSTFEIIVVEDQSEKNVAWVHDAFTPEWLEERNTRLIEYAADYPNPHGYNMIEAYAKNVGLRMAKYSYVCLTNCDVLFNTAFFDLCQRRLQPRTFYRFLEYETTPVVSWNLKKIQETFADSKCINEGLLTQRNLKTVAFKSGDAMLMDAESWRLIRGFPENEVWVHSDLIVCNVVNNNGLALMVDLEAKVYTYPQERDVVEREFELAKTYEYLYRRTCN